MRAPARALGRGSCSVPGGHAGELAQEVGADFFGEIPIDTRIRFGGDAGVPIVMASPDSENTQRFMDIASKTALNAFTVHLAHELRGTPVKVNSAHPGWVKTDMGGSSAPMEVSEGGKTSVQLATLPDDGPTGGFFHLGEPLPW